MENDVKQKIADTVIHNDGNESELYKKAKKVFEEVITV